MQQLFASPVYICRLEGIKNGIRQGITVFMGIVNISLHFLPLTPRFTTLQRLMVRLAIVGVSVKNPSPRKGGGYPHKNVLQQQPQWSDCPQILYFGGRNDFELYKKKKNPQNSEMIFCLISGGCPAIVLTNITFWSLPEVHSQTDLLVKTV